MADTELPRSTQALLLVDFINPLDFPGAEDLAPTALKAAGAALSLARRARAAGVPVIYANDNFGLWRSNFGAIVEALRKRGGVSGEIAAMLRPGQGDLTLLKPMHSAFFGSPLELLLEKMGVRSLVLTGLATDICIQLTAADAYLRGYKVKVPPECTAAESESKRHAALIYMRDILKCDVRSADRLAFAKRVAKGKRSLAHRDSAIE